MRGCEIRVVIGNTDVAHARYLAMDTASPYMATFDPAAAGKIAQDFLR